MLEPPVRGTAAAQPNGHRPALQGFDPLGLGYESTEYGENSYLLLFCSALPCPVLPTLPCPAVPWPAQSLGGFDVATAYLPGISTLCTEYPYSSVPSMGAFLAQKNLLTLAPRLPDCCPLSSVPCLGPLSR